MERNYDEIIADMLRQIDRHTAQLTIQSAELTQQSKQSAEEWREQKLINAKVLAEMDAIASRGKEQDAIRNNHLELILHTANILDRIIKRNDLKV